MCIRDSIYTVVLILDIILLLSLQNVGELSRQRKYGTEFVPSTSKTSMKKQWGIIETRLQSGNPSEYKVAILEADKIVEGILADLGYGAKEDMAAKIEQLRVVQADDAELLYGAHEVRNRIIFEQDFHPSLEEAKKTTQIYKDFLKQFEYFS